jgi:hypothetical protein
VIPYASGHRRCGGTIYDEPRRRVISRGLDVSGRRVLEQPVGHLVEINHAATAATSGATLL